MVKGKHYISALDIGTSKVIALIGEVQEDNQIHIVGIGQAPSRGLKAGMVTNIDATAQAIKHAVSEAELMADCKVGSVTTGIAGNHIRSLNSQGVVKIKDGSQSGGYRPRHRNGESGQYPAGSQYSAHCGSGIYYR